MLKNLKTQHRSIIQMSFNGFKNHEIAEKHGLTQSTISTILHSPLGKAYLNGLHDRAQEQTLDVRKKLIDMNASALDAISNILDPDTKAPFNVQLTAAKDVLDRNGYKPTDKFEIDINSQKTDEEIDAEIQAMENAINHTQAQEIDSSNESFDSSIVSEPKKPVPVHVHVPDSGSVPPLVDLDPDISAKLADVSFDPFKNI